MEAIDNILNLLSKSDYYGYSETIEVAKGKYKIPKTIKEKREQIKREKEWLKTKMGETYQRKIWREIHIGVDGKGNILDIQMTNHKTSGRVMLKTITENIETEFIDELLGDGGYARHYNYRYLKENNINTLIFPLKNARIIENIPDLETHNNIVAYINEKDFTLGKKNNFYRLKTIFGRKLKSKNWHTLESETNLIAHLLNQMINFGMPEKMKVS